MSLIKCPECGKEISDKALQCIHCGFPIDNKTETTTDKSEDFVMVGEVEYDISGVIKLIKKGDKIGAIKKMHEITNVGFVEARKIVDKIYINESYKQEICSIKSNKSFNEFITYDGDLRKSLIAINYSNECIEKIIKNPAYSELEKTLSKDEIIYFASEMFLPNSSIIASMIADVLCVITQRRIVFCSKNFLGVSGNSIKFEHITSMHAHSFSQKDSKIIELNLINDDKISLSFYPGKASFVAYDILNVLVNGGTIDSTVKLSYSPRENSSSVTQSTYNSRSAYAANSSVSATSNYAKTTPKYNYDPLTNYEKKFCNNLNETLKNLRKTAGVCLDSYVMFPEYRHRFARQLEQVKIHRERVVLFYVDGVGKEADTTGFIVTSGHFLFLNDLKLVPVKDILSIKLITQQSNKYLWVIQTRDAELKYKCNRRDHNLDEVLNNAIKRVNIDSMNGEDLCEIAWKHYEKGDFEEALKWYEYASKKNSARAKTVLGTMYESGKGVKQDYEKAIELYRDAIKNEWPSAYSNLAELYISGNGTVRDYNEGIKLLEKAVELDADLTSERLGDLLCEGASNKEEYEKVLYYYKKEGIPSNLIQYKIRAVEAMINYYASNQDVSVLGKEIDNIKRLFETNKSEEAYVIADILSRVNSKALFYVGTLKIKMNNGKETKEAYEYIATSAERGYIGAQNVLAYAYYKGDTVLGKNNELALKYFKLAAESDDDAKLMCGVLCMSLGKTEEAVSWYKKAAECGIPEAYANLGKAYLSGQGVNENLSEAYVWLKKAADNNVAEAMNNLGVYYEKVGDYNNAKSCFETALSKGFELAKTNLKNLKHVKIIDKMVEPKVVDKKEVIESHIASHRAIKDNKNKNKYIAAMLAFFLGMFGGHKFYTGHWIAGVVYILISLTGISALLSFIEAIIYLVMSSEKFDSKIVKRKEK